MKRSQIVVTLLSLGLWIFSWSMSSPPGSEPDAPFHYSMIWCTRDAPRAACLDPNISQVDPRVVTVQLWDQMCYRDQLHRSAKCGDGFGETSEEIDEDSYPRGFYRVMNLLARGDVIQGTLLMRAANGIFATLLFCAALTISAGRLRKCFVLGLLVTLGPLHLSLVSAVHAQSWLIPALGTAWVFVLVALDEAKSRRQRLIALAGWIVGLSLSVSSRWEGGPLFLAVSVMALILAPSADRWLGKFVVKMSTSLLVFVFLLLQFTNSVFSARRWVAGPPGSLASSSGPDTWDWFSSWLMAFPGVMVEMYGTQGFASEMRPALLLVPVIGGVLFGGIILSQVVDMRRKQVIVLCIWSLLTFVCVLYFTNSGLDLYDIDARYVTQFAHPFLGMFLFAGSGKIPLIDDRQGRRFLVIATTLSTFLSQYFFLERYVRGVQPGVRWMNVGINEWWWSGIEIGPNGVLFIGVGTFLLLAQTITSIKFDCSSSKSKADIKQVKSA